MDAVATLVPRFSANTVYPKFDTARPWPEQHQAPRLGSFLFARARGPVDGRLGNAGSTCVVDPAAPQNARGGISFDTSFKASAARPHSNSASSTTCCISAANARSSAPPGRRASWQCTTNVWCIRRKNQPACRVDATRTSSTATSNWGNTCRSWATRSGCSPCWKESRDSAAECRLPPGLRNWSNTGPRANPLARPHPFHFSLIFCIQ